MKRPTMLYQAILTQVSIDLKVSTERDYEYIRSRIEHEGLSFLTITLPVLSDSLEEGLETGRFTLPNGFKPFKRSGTLPALLQGLFKRVFMLDGSLQSEPCPASIYWIRQISRFFKKPRISCSPQREAEAIMRFKTIEEELNDQSAAISRKDTLLDTVATILWSSVFPTVDHDSIVCGHGPGVTADRRLPNERRRIREWYQRFESSFPCADHAFPNYGLAWSGGCSEGVSGIKFIDLKDESPVRVVFVPKTLKAPRVIAIEPSVMQFVQQGLSRWMVSTLEDHRLTRNSVRFSDQTTNRRLAYEASVNRRLATIDLSDASDRVHLDLVRRIFSSSPIKDYLDDARSLHADLPDSTNIILNKYASMGSALCFPVEACVFYTLVLTSIVRATGKRPTYKLIERLSRDISVFGDDIIVPTRYVDVVSSYLESYALRVNRRKSFSRSAFRESCGADYFNGYSVLPVYAREVAPARREEWTPSHIMAWISTSDQFYISGSWHVCQVIRDMVEDVVRCRLPRSRVETSGLGFYSLLYDTKLRWHQSLYSYRQSRLHFLPTKVKDIIDGDLTACLNLYFERSSPEDSPAGRYDTLYEWSCRRAESSPVEFLGRELPDLRLRFKYNVSTANSSGPMDRQNAKPGRMVGLSHQSTRRIEGVPRPSSSLLRIDPSRIDFHNTTKRGVFTLKRQWTTIFS